MILRASSRSDGLPGDPYRTPDEGRAALSRWLKDLVRSVDEYDFWWAFFDDLDDYFDDIDIERVWPDHVVSERRAMGRR